MKDLKVGETIDFKGHLLIVEKAIDEYDKCKGCLFDTFLDCTKEAELLGNCSYWSREDKTDVIFKEINI